MARGASSRARSRANVGVAVAAMVAFAAASILPFGRPSSSKICHAFSVGGTGSPSHRTNLPSSHRAPPLPSLGEAASRRRRRPSPPLHATADGSASASAPSASVSSTPSTVAATISNTYDRPAAQDMVHRTLCPPNEERERSLAGMEAYHGGSNDGGGGTRGEAIANDDPRGEYTYGEFPFDSFDVLVDRATELVPQSAEGRCKTMVDLGSGCGRLVFYAGLTRGGEGSETWDVHGVEIGTQLHSLAATSLQRGVEQGWFASSADVARTADGGSQIIAFHNGNALLVDDPYYSQSSPDETHDTIRSLLATTDVLFAYSTVWETNPSRPFDPELGAMVLSPKWSKALAERCREGCVAVTTDRALNPDDGWRLLDRMDVDNPSVWGSVGYISVLERR